MQFEKKTMGRRISCSTLDEMKEYFYQTRVIEE